jgi:hypothetical protein
MVSINQNIDMVSINRNIDMISINRNIDIINKSRHSCTYGFDKSIRDAFGLWLNQHIFLLLGKVLAVMLLLHYLILFTTVY